MQSSDELVAYFFFPGFILLYFIDFFDSPIRSPSIDLHSRSYANNGGTVIALCLSSSLHNTTPAKRGAWWFLDASQAASKHGAAPAPTFGFLHRILNLLLFLLLAPSGSLLSTTRKALLI